MILGYQNTTALYTKAEFNLLALSLIVKCAPIQKKKLFTVNLIIGTKLFAVILKSVNNMTTLFTKRKNFFSEDWSNRIYTKT